MQPRLEEVDEERVISWLLWQQMSQVGPVKVDEDKGSLASLAQWFSNGFVT